MDHPRPCARCPEVQPDPAAPVVVTKPGAPPPVIARVPTSDPVVFVTIDDGRVANEDAATILVEARLPITLFLTGQFIADKLPYMHRIVDAGAWVEPHTITHPDLSRTAAQRNEVCEPVDTYGREFGRVGTLFRPPYGRFSQTTRNAAASCGLQAIILWKAATNDGEVQTQGKPLQAGDIVMMHFRDDLASNLRALFDAIIARGLRVGRLECYVGGDPRCGRDATSA